MELKGECMGTDLCLCCCASPAEDESGLLLEAARAYDASQGVRAKGHRYITFGKQVARDTRNRPRGEDAEGDVLLVQVSVCVCER